MQFPLPTMIGDRISFLFFVSFFFKFFFGMCDIQLKSDRIWRMWSHEKESATHTKHYKCESKRMSKNERKKVLC